MHFQINTVNFSNFGPRIATTNRTVTSAQNQLKFEFNECTNKNKWENVRVNSMGVGAKVIEKNKKIDEICASENEWKKTLKKATTNIVWIDRAVFTQTVV